MSNKSRNKNINFIIITLFIATTLKLNSLSAKLNNNKYTDKAYKAVKTAGHWGAFAGPIWAEAYNYVSLISENQALKIFGTEDVSKETDKEIRKQLKEIKFEEADEIIIKILKPEMRNYVISAIVCTDSIIFINPEYYDILDRQEKNAVITRAAIMIESKHLKQNALVLSLIPLVTHCAVQGYEASIKKICNIMPERFSNRCLKKICVGHTYIIGSWLGKLVINTALSSAYFKVKALYTDLKTIQQIKSAKPLISYYRKVRDKHIADDLLLNIIKLPDNRKENYLKRLVQLSSYKNI